MSINEVLQNVHQINSSVNETDVEDYCLKAGKSPEQLIADDCIEIASRYGNSAKLATKQQNKPVKGGSNRQQQKQAPSTSPLAQMAVQIDAEMSAFRSGVEQGAEAIITSHEEQIFSVLEDAPNELVRRVTQRAGGYTADADSFRQLGMSIFAGIG